MSFNFEQEKRFTAFVQTIPCLKVSIHNVVFFVISAPLQKFKLKIVKMIENQLFITEACQPHISYVIQVSEYML